MTQYPNPFIHPQQIALESWINISDTSHAKALDIPNEDTRYRHSHK